MKAGDVVQVTAARSWAHGRRGEVMAVKDGQASVLLPPKAAPSVFSVEQLTVDGDAPAPAKKKRRR